MDDLFAKVRASDVARSADDRLMEGGIFKTMFLRQSSLILEEIFPALQEKLSCPEFQDAFLAQHRKEIKIQREQLCSDAERLEAAGRDARFYTCQLPTLDRQLAIDSLDDYFQFLKTPAEGHGGIIELLIQDYAILHGDNDGTEYVKVNYPIYRIGSFLYERYLSKVSVFERFEKPYSEKLISLYRERLGVDLATVDQQFRKYDLLSLGPEFTIFNSKESQTIVDGRIGLKFWIDVPRELLAAIEDALARKWVPSIAFNIGLITEAAPAFEAVEYGSVFSFQALQLPPASKLYDDERYDDALWIKVGTGPYSMTFEELCADFPVLDGNVVTQVVHLEFFVDEGRYFISHLDHEYILYTQDAYDQRRYDATIKGYKKRKTFKIDKAVIPFDFTFMGRYFLFMVLDTYFKNKRLIREYFASVSQG